MTSKILLLISTLIKLIDYSNAAQSCPTNSSIFSDSYLSPINLITSSAQKITTPLPLTQSNGIIDELLVKNTGYALEVYGHPFSITTSSIYNGALCGYYKFHVARFYYSLNITERCYDQVDGVQAPFIITIYYYNSEYSSFEEALQHPGNTLGYEFRLTFSTEENYLFTIIQPFIELLKFPGTELYAPSILIYGFFYRIPFIKSYYIYPGSYYDPKTNKQYPGVIVFVAEGLYKVFTEKQFEVFKDVLGADGKPLETKAPILYDQGSRPVQIAYGYKGIFSLI